MDWQDSSGRMHNDKTGRFEEKMSDIQKKAKESVKGTQVVDEKGEPIIVYHGMPKDGGEHKSWRFYLTEDKSIADTYKKENGKVVAGYVDIKNIVEFDFEGGFFSRYKDGRNTDQIAFDVAKEGKYDGIRFKNIIDAGVGVKKLSELKPTTQYVIFDPSKFKGFRVEK